MKKTVPIFALLVLLVQTFVGPVVAVAETLKDNDIAPAIELTALTSTLKDQNDHELVNGAIIQKETDYWLELTGSLIKGSQLAETIELELSKNLVVMTNEVPVVNLAGQALGSLKSSDNALALTLLPEQTGLEEFTVRVPVRYENVAELLEDTLSINSPLGKTEWQFSLASKETTESTVESKEETIGSTTIESNDDQELKETPKSAKPVKATKGLIDNKIPVNIFTSVDYQVTPDGAEPTIDAKYKINFDWALPEEIRQQMVGGETFTYQLPAEFKIHNSQEGPLTYGDEAPFGHFTISESGEVVITFNENVTTMQDIDGTLTIATFLNKEIITSPEDVKITIPLKGEDKVITIPIKSTSVLSLDKMGAADKAENPTAIDWTVYVNKTKTNLTDIIVTDTLPAGLTLDSLQTVQVFEVMVGHDGEIGNDIRKLEQTDFSTTGSAGQKLVVTIPGTSKKTYRIVYHTKIEETAKPDDGGKPTFTNEAIQTSTGGETVKATATVNTTYKKGLEKDLKKYNQDE